MGDADALGEEVADADREGLGEVTADGDAEGLEALGADSSGAELGTLSGAVVSDEALGAATLVSAAIGSGSVPVRGSTDAVGATSVAAGVGSALTDSVAVALDELDGAVDGDDSGVAETEAEALALAVALALGVALAETVGLGLGEAVTEAEGLALGDALTDAVGLGDAEICASTSSTSHSGGSSAGAFVAAEVSAANATGA